MVRVVQPAASPTKPSSTGLPVTLALGLLAGLAVGVGGRSPATHSTPRSRAPSSCASVAKAPNLGIIAYDAAVPKRPLTVHEDPQSPRSEAFRQLRTNLQFLDVDTPHKVVVVTSSMPSEGKTTTLANLAIALGSAGQRVLAIEADLRRPKLADMLGLERSVGLTSVLAGPGAARARRAALVGRSVRRPRQRTASAQSRANCSRRSTWRRCCSELREHYDMSLLDTPPLLPVTDAAAVAPATDGAILVCRFKTTTRDQVAKAVEALDAVSTPLLGTVLTMVPSTGPRAYAQYNSYYRTVQTVAPISPATGSPRVAKPYGQQEGEGVTPHGPRRQGRINRSR